jgi:dTDP-glucose pyrophosphorylase/CBS domain-containing protein
LKYKEKKFKCESLFVSKETPLREAVATIERNHIGIALVVDDDRHLIGTVTDGDIRRAILEGTSLDSLVSEVLNKKINSLYPKPVTAPVGTKETELLRIMQEFTIHQLPLIGDDGRVEDLVTIDELIPRQPLPIQAVVMAGGIGRRLSPLTKKIPKSMLPIGGQPLMEHIISQLSKVGIQHVTISTHFMSKKIVDHFSDGLKYGVHIEYVSEDQPLGTAGALGLIKMPDQPILVINGDILTNIDFRAMLSFHREQNADLTVAVREYKLQVPYGIIKTSGIHVEQIQEKPVYNFFVNAGIYLLEPSVLRLINTSEYLDMTDLIKRMIAEGKSIISFPIIEYWLDIGQHENYLQAQKDFKNGRFSS